MSYQQTTDLKTSKHRDFKGKLLHSKKILDEIQLGDILCIVYKKDKWYYKVEDVATWSKCGNIRTVLFYRIKDKPKKKVTTFHGTEQFLFKFKNKYAIYSVQVYARNSYNKNMITHVSLQKVPNLRECTF